MDKNAALTATAGYTGATTNFMSIKQAFSSPALPQSYAALCKAVLRYRQKRVYALTLVGIAALLPLSTFPITGLDSALALIYPTVWLALGIAFIGVLGIFVARKRYIETTQDVWPDRLAQYTSLLTLQRARRTLLAYLWHASGFALAFVLLVSYLAPGRSYAPLYRVPGRDGLSVNERYVYIFLSIVTTSMTYGVQQIINGRHILVFPLSQSPIPARLQHKFKTRIVGLPAMAASSNIAFLGLYLLLKRSFLRFIIYRVPGGRMLRPYFLNMLRVNNLSASLILTGLSMSLASLLILELANTLADVYYSQPIAVSTYSPGPDRTLLDGLRSPDPYIRRFAYFELQQLVLNDRSRRMTIFRDIKSKSFENISQSCLQQLKQSYETLQRRGAPPPPPVSSSGQEERNTDNVSAAQVPVSRENAFQPVAKTFTDRLTGLATSSNPGQPGVTLPTRATTTALEQVPAIFRQKIQEASPAVVIKEATKVQEAVRGVEKTLADKLKDFSPSTFQDIDLDSCAAKSLGTLLKASLEEDQYGVAQGDISRTLETFGLYYDALEAYETDLKNAGNDGRFAPDDIKTQLSARVHPLSDVLHGETVGILKTFRAYLDDIKLPTIVAKKMRNLV